MYILYACIDYDIITAVYYIQNTTIYAYILLLEALRNYFSSNHMIFLFVITHYSDIYCHGELLDDIQMQQLYSDSKTFVDKKLRRSEAEIIKSYRELKLRNNGRVPTRAVLTKFVEDNFSDDPLVEWVPPDFVETPTISTYVQDQNYK